MSPKKIFIIKALAGTILILTAFIACIYSLTIPSIKDTLILATTVKPESFTELYYQDYLTIPRSTATQSAQKLAFTIHNVEHKTITYPYHVYIEDRDGNKATIAQESVTLKRDESKTIPLYYELLVQIKRAKVVVKLIEKNQEIHYWIGEGNK